MKSIEEYLYYHENQDYINLKFLSCTYYRNKQLLLVRYIYNAEIEAFLPSLRRRLEELFIQRVGLPIKYDFVYKKVFIDPLSLQLDVVSFLRKKYGAMANGIKDTQVNVKIQGNIWLVEISLPESVIKFLQHSKPWKKFQQDLSDHSFYEFNFELKVI